MESNVIKESDLIKLDGTIESFIKQLNELNTVYASSIASIKKGAADAEKALKAASGATAAGKNAINEAIAASGQYKVAQSNLSYALAEAGKQVRWLKAQVVDSSKVSADQQKVIASEVAAYGKLAAEVKELAGLYGVLSGKELAEANYGGEVAKQMREKQAQMTALNSAIKTHVGHIVQQQKAQEKLARSYTAEGQAHLQTMRAVRESTKVRKTEKASTDSVIASKRKMVEINGSAYQKQIALNLSTREAVQYSRLLSKEALAVEGSYNKLSATYSRTKFELRNLDATLPENAKLMQQLTNELNEAYTAMKRFQESTGVHSLNVGAYKQAFSGVNFAVQQVAREVPNITLGVDRFFLAISNNIPILADEIKRSSLAFKVQKKEIMANIAALKAQRAALLKTGAATTEVDAAIAKQAATLKSLKSPMSQVLKSLFSWQTAMVAGLTIMTMHGAAIVEWIGDILRADNALARLRKALKDIQKALKDDSSGYASNAIKIRKLRDEYVKLETEAEKQEWVEKHKNDWSNLNVAIYDAVDAEAFFISNTAQVKDAFVKRARAAAAFSLAEKEYEKLLTIEGEKERIRAAGVGAFKGTGPVVSPTTGAIVSPGVTAQEQFDEALAKQDKLAEKTQKNIDLLYKLGTTEDEAANAVIGVYEEAEGKAGIQLKTMKDVNDYIVRERIKVTKDSNNAIAKMEDNEFDRRRKEKKTKYDAETDDLKKTIAKNNEILSGYGGVKLSDKQREELEKMNEDAAIAIANYGKAYSRELEDITLDEAIFLAEQEAKLLQTKLEAVKEGSEEEFDLRNQLLDAQYKKEILQAKKLAKNKKGVYEGDIANLMRTMGVAESEIDRYAELLGRAFEKYGITDFEAIKAFMARMKQETQGFTKMKEGGSEEYLKSKDYYPYYGRGGTQLTWDYNYEAYAKDIGVSVEELMTGLIEDAFLAMDSSGWFFKQNKLDEVFAKHGAEGMWRLINAGGVNQAAYGIPETQKQYDKIKDIKASTTEPETDTEDIKNKYLKLKADLDAAFKLRGLKAIQAQIDLQLEKVKEGSKEEYDLRKASIKNQYKMEILENSLLAEKEQQSEKDIKDKYDEQLEDLEYDHQMRMIDIQKEAIRLRLGNIQAGSEQELELLLDQIELERQAALKANKQLALDLQQSEDVINDYYKRQADIAKGKHALSALSAEQTSTRTAISNIVAGTGDVSEHTTAGKRFETTLKYGTEESSKRKVFEYTQDIYALELKIADLRATGGSAEAIAAAQAEKAAKEQSIVKEGYKIKRDKEGNIVRNEEGEPVVKKTFEGVIGDIAEGGLAAPLLETLGFDDKGIDAFNGAVDQIIDGINSILEAEIEAAEQALELQQERVEAAQAAYDAEIEARNNGYANSVETARKELEEERRKEAEKQKMLEEAQKKQEAVNTIVQTSSLITAAAQIWSSMSGLGPAGPVIAAASIALMFGSFLAAKVKAKQVSQQYGEGGLEFLEGGSHASGNDISLDTKNKKGKNMRAEGGEALAIINKKSTSKYKRQLPDIIDSLNKGTFEDKYLNAFASPDGSGLFFNQETTIDLSTLEGDVRKIRSNSETRYYATPDGATVVRYKNRRRIIRNS